jgi:uncharacterized protein with PhoU and TrkA domain
MMPLFIVKWSGSAMRYLKSLLMAGTAMLAGYAIKKMIGKIEAQVESARVKAESARDPKTLKQLKQDPVTGVYYAED